MAYKESSSMDIDGFTVYLLELANEYVHKYDTVDDAYTFYINYIKPSRE